MNVFLRNKIALNSILLSLLISSSQLFVTHQEFVAHVKQQELFDQEALKQCKDMIIATLQDLEKRENHNQGKAHKLKQLALSIKEILKKI